MLSLLGYVDLGTTTQLLKANVLCFLVFLPLRHAFFYQLLYKLVLVLAFFLKVWLGQRLIEPLSLFKVNVS